MLLDENNYKASENESSLTEGSFDNDQISDVDVADREIYSDQPAWRSPEAKAIVQKARDIAARAKKQASGTAPAKEKTTSHGKPKDAAKNSVLQKAKQAGQMLKKKSASGKGGEKKQGGFAEKIGGTGKAKPKQKGKAGGQKEEGKSSGLLSQLSQFKKAVSNKHDPRAMAAELADETLHLGRVVGFLLWLIWGVLSWGGLLPTVIVGLIAGVIWNIMLFSPKTVYHITKWIIYLIPGADAVMKGLEEAGLGKTDIHIGEWEKALIVAYDFFILVLFIVVLGFAISATGWYVCNETVAGTTGILGTIASRLVDWWTSTDYATTVNEMCKAIKGS